MGHANDNHHAPTEELEIGGVPVWLMIAAANDAAARERIERKVRVQRRLLLACAIAVVVLAVGAVLVVGGW
jgi:hypothetical protein